MPAARLFLPGLLLLLRAAALALTSVAGRSSQPQRSAPNMGWAALKTTDETAPLRTDAATVNCSVVVYGATAAGVTAAVAAAREGASLVCLIGDRANVGGCTSGGLGKTDVGLSAAIGGQAARLYEHVGTYYNLSLPIQSTALIGVRPSHCDPAVRPCRYYGFGATPRPIYRLLTLNTANFD